MKNYACFIFMFLTITTVVHAQKGNEVMFDVEVPADGCDLQGRQISHIIHRAWFSDIKKERGGYRVKCPIPIDITTLVWCEVVDEDKTLKKLFKTAKKNPETKEKLSTILSLTLRNHVPDTKWIVVSNVILKDP